MLSDNFSGSLMPGIDDLGDAQYRTKRKCTVQTNRLVNDDFV